VNIIAKGTIAKSEKAVYHFKEGKIVFTNSPRVIKDNAEMKGESIEYDTNSKNITVKQPKMRLAK
jgi:lipopolysaccharide export system protein LptA